MSDLQIRRVPFRFDEATPYQWHPTNPDFGPPAQRHQRDRRRLRDLHRGRGPPGDGPDHRRRAWPTRPRTSSARRPSTPGPTASTSGPSPPQYPGVKGVVDDAVASYDIVLEREPLEFHLAYIADLEATFTPHVQDAARQPGLALRPGRRPGGVAVPVALRRGGRAPQLGAAHLRRRGAAALVPAPGDAPGLRARLAALLPGDGRLRGARPGRGPGGHDPTGAVGHDLARASWRPGCRSPAGGRRGATSTRRRSTRCRTATCCAWRGGWRSARCRATRPAREPVPAFAAEWFAGYERGVDVTRWFASAAA